MVFSSTLFMFYFLPTVLILYFISPKSMKNTILFVASLLFYSWGEPIYVVIMLFSTFFDYTNGLFIEKFNNQGNNRAKKVVLIISVLGNLAILAFFKYTDFFIGNINELFNLSIQPLKLALPIGISFYTFQTMSYTIDVYRGDAPVQKNIISFGAYVVLFPQLIAGPIVRYNTIADQLNSRTVTHDKFSDGVGRFTVGLAKKILLANNVGLLWDSIKVLPQNDMSVMLAWLGIIAFAFQIYFDFSGYSDMAIGLGKMFGFEFWENFNYPYISTSITDFWRRWHISLSTWFREYVYIPLGGNRKGKNRTFFNLFVVWLATGFWHGASWNYIIWGLYFFAFLMIEKLFLGKFLSKHRIFSHVYSILVILISWVIFAIEDLSALWQYLGYLVGVGANGFVGNGFLYYAFSYAPVLIVCAIASTPFGKEFFKKFFGEKMYFMKIVFVAVALITCTAYLVDASYNPFLYFRF